MTLFEKTDRSWIKQRAARRDPIFKQMALERVLGRDFFKFFEHKVPMIPYQRFIMRRIKF